MAGRRSVQRAAAGGGCARRCGHALPVWLTREAAGRVPSDRSTAAGGRGTRSGSVGAGAATWRVAAGGAAAKSGWWVCESLRENAHCCSAEPERSPVSNLREGLTPLPRWRLLLSPTV